MPTSKALKKAEMALRKVALGYPETVEEFPWGHRAIKVKGKTFVFLALFDNVLSMSVKLPFAGASALTLPFASPTEYGLGKSGWVTARFSPDDGIPVEMLSSWIDESFQAIAPKKVLAQLAGVEPPATKKKSPRPRR